MRRRPGTHGSQTHARSSLSCEAARRVGARCLLIKGSTLDWHGLRPPRVPADVDVLVAPGDVEAFIAQLEEWGWHTRLSLFPGPQSPRHAVTLIHDEWPCDIDIHRRFPGFLRDPANVFDVLWKRRELMPVASASVSITDKTSSILIMALHDIRSTEQNPRHAQELHRILELNAALSTVERNDLAMVAEQTGADHALGGALTGLGIPKPPHGSTVDADELRRWRRWMLGRESYSRIWLRYILEASPHRWPGRIREALWPSEAAFRAMRPALVLPPGRKALNAARRKRLKKGFCGAPSALLRALGLQKAGVLNIVEQEANRRINSESLPC